VAAETLAETHQVGQEALVSLIPSVIREAWPLLDVHNLRGTMPQFLATVRAIVARYGSASAAGALDYYRRERAAAGVVGRAPSLRIAPTPADSVIEEAIGWATSDLYGPVTDESVASAQAKVEEAVSKLVLDQGRDTIIGATNTDKAAKGWVRVTEQGACSFCIMLALRGATYKSQRSADFPAHDNCRCHVEPIFTEYEPSHRMRELQRVWAESTRGRGGHDARVAFRQAVEGREVTGAKNVKTPNATKGLHALSRSQVEHQIALLEGLKDSEYRTTQLARLRKALRTAK
jgi:hypothetical protein